MWLPAVYLPPSHFKAIGGPEEMRSMEQEDSDMKASIIEALRACGGRITPQSILDR